MQIVYYAGTVLTTGDEIAAAFCAAALRVCESGRAEHLEVPCRSVNGVVAEGAATLVTIVAVPGVAVVAVHLPQEGGELEDAQAVARLMQGREIPRAIPHDAEGSGHDVEATYDFDEWI